MTDPSTYILDKARLAALDRDDDRALGVYAVTTTPDPVEWFDEVADWTLDPLPPEPEAWTAEMSISPIGLYFAHLVRYNSVLKPLALGVRKPVTVEWDSRLPPRLTTPVTFHAVPAEAVGWGVSDCLGRLLFWQTFAAVAVTVMPGDDLFLPVILSDGLL